MRIIVSMLAIFAFVTVFIAAIAQAANVVYLSDLSFKPSGLKGNPNGGYFDGIRVNSHNTIITMSGSQSNGWDRPTQINGQEYDKSLLFHVVKDETVEATWALKHNFTKLTAMIGLDDTQDIPGIYPLITVNFSGDGKALGSASIQSVFGKPNPTPSVDINVSGVNSLTVAITFKGTGGGTNIDIVNPELQPVSGNSSQ
jgi:NPCBM/NEW2 domain